MAVMSAGQQNEYHMLFAKGAFLSLNIRDVWEHTGLQKYQHSYISSGWLDDWHQRAVKFLKFLKLLCFACLFSTILLSYAWQVKSCIFNIYNSMIYTYIQLNIYNTLPAPLLLLFVCMYVIKTLNRRYTLLENVQSLIQYC